MISQRQGRNTYFFMVHILILRVAFLSCVLFLASAGSFARNSSSEFREALSSAGISTDQISIITEKLNFNPTSEKTISCIQWLKSQGVEDVGKFLSSYPQALKSSIEETLNPKAEWFKSRGVKNVGKFLSSSPIVLTLSIKENLQPTLNTLIRKFHLKIEQIEEAPILLEVSNSRINILAEGLEEIGFDVRSLSLSKLRKIIMSVSIQHVLENLKRDHWVRDEVLSVSEINPQERMRIYHLIEGGGFVKMLKKSVPCGDLLETKTSLPL